MAQQQAININDTSGVECVKCGGFTFKEVLMLRKVSRFITGAPTDIVMPVPIIVCANCNTVCVDALAPEVKNLFEAPPGVEDTEDEVGAKVIKMFD